MKIVPLYRRRRGSALITVIMLCFFMAILAGSMLRYTVTERRGNERNRLILKANNAAENTAIYAAEQLSTKLYRLGSVSNMAFAWTGSTRNRVYPPPDSALNGPSTSAANVEVRAGIASASALTLVTDTTDPNFGLQVSKARVPVIARASASHKALGSFTSHVEQDMEIALTPLFQFGMFYNMDLELYPSQAMSISGPVHSNKSIMAKPYGSTSIALTFVNRATAAGGLYASASVKAPTRSGDGALVTETASAGDVIFTHTNGSTTASLKNSSNQWRDHKYTTSTETTTTIANFKTFATNTYNGNLRTSAHGVTGLELPGVGSYKETDDPSTSGDDRNNGRQIIEPPNPQRYAGGTWTATTDDPDTKESKIAYKAGLYIMVNPDPSPTPRSGILPDGTTAYVLPCSYRAWINYLDGSSNRVCTEVVLPGQPSYGYAAGPDGTLGTTDDVMYRNYLPNRYTTLSAGGTSMGNQLLRIPQGGFNIASGYKINGAQAIGTAAVAVDSGTGPIQAGEVVTIGSYNYVVAEYFAGGSGNLKLATGLIAAAADNAGVSLVEFGTFSQPTNAYTTYSTNSAGQNSSGRYYVNLRTSNSSGSSAIAAGATITIGSFKYLVTAAPTTGVGNNSTTLTLYLGAPGLSSSPASGSSVTVDTTSFAVGTGAGYRINGTPAAAATSVSLDTGTGTILPGNLLFMGGNRYVVTQTAHPAPTSGGTFRLASGLVAALADDTTVVLDPYASSGYQRSSAYPVANTGRAFPTDSTAPYIAADAYFFDTRRANSNRGVTGTSGTTAVYNRHAVPYVPRPVAKIDFDLTRFKMMATRVLGSSVRTSSNTTTASIYDVRAPNATGVTWTNSIFNNASSAARTSAGLGVLTGTTYTPASFSVFPAATNADTKIAPDPFNLYYAPAAPETTDLAEVVDTPMNQLVPASILYDGTAPDAWYDGFAIYLHSVDAEKRAQTSGVPNRVDSGVRLWNGRGPVASLNITNVTGFTFVTNDATYVVGHFNADGTINSTTSSSSNPGGYSATYSDSADERLCSIMGDAFTALAHPSWDSATSGQSDGWNDALSAFPVGTAASDWRTGSSSTDTLNGSYDGLYASSGVVKPSLLPNENPPGSLGSATNKKLSVVATEMSTALLVGIVPSNHNPIGLTDGYVPSSFLSWGTPSRAGNGVNSGGANNFPRLLEAWGGTGLYIRGSMVALFESRVAMEPFTNGRNYTAPGRYWGLHYNFSQASHDLPLEPIVLGCSRVGFRELTPAQYAAKKTEIESWPH